MATRIAEASELAFAERIALDLCDEFIYTQTHEWMWYDGKQWMPKMTPLLNYQVNQGMRALRYELFANGRDDLAKQCMPNRTRVMQVVANMRELLWEPTDIDAFDASPDHLNVANGVVDLRTGELTQHDPKQRFTYCLDTAYYPKKKPSAVWNKYLIDTVPEDVLPLLQMAVGYSLTGHTIEECMFYIYGPTRAGKGVFSETLLRLLTKALATEVEFNTFTRDRDNDANNFDLAPLKPARLLFASESSRTMRLNDAKVKHLTGGNYVRCSFKFGTHFTYRPQFKIWLVSNFDINADPNDDAVWGRIIRLPFPNSYKGNEDKLLKAKLLQVDALEGVLQWAVEGAQIWYKNGLVVPKSLEMDTDEVRAELDTVQAWLDECAVLAPNEFVSNGELHVSYEMWCKQHGLKPYGSVWLSRVMVAKELAPARRAQQRGFVDIALRGGTL